MDRLKPDISVCVVFRNAERGLPALLQSFDRGLNHESLRLEFILIDNASDDASSEMARGFQTPKGPVWSIRREKNSLGLARQQAVELSRGRFIYFVDSDCEIFPETLSTLYGKIQTLGADVAGVGGGQMFSSAFGERLHLFRQSVLGHLGSAQMKILSQGAFTSHLSTCSVLYRREAILAVGGFHPKLETAAEDLELSLRLNQRGYKLYFEPRSWVLHHHASRVSLWFKKAFRNGLWQTRLAAFNRAHLKSYRFWLTPLFHLTIAALLILAPKVIFLLAGLYGGLVVWESLRLSSMRGFIALSALFFSTHFIYLWAGTCGFFLALKDFALSQREPSSTNTA
jgi:GT2 family glycosyltransferase